MKSTIFTSWASVLATVVLVACTTPTTAPQPGSSAPVAAVNLAQAAGNCGPCCGKNPAAEASGTQGSFPYVGKDTYTNVIVNQGLVLYSLTPGAPPGFAVPEHTLREANGSWEKYYDLVQVTTDPGKDAAGAPRRLRVNVRAFHVSERICAAMGIARANPHFGSGGGTQYYVSPSDGDKLSPGDTSPISQWHPLTQ